MGVSGRPVEVDGSSFRSPDRSSLSIYEYCFIFWGRRPSFPASGLEICWPRARPWLARRNGLETFWSLERASLDGSNERAMRTLICYMYSIFIHKTSCVRVSKLYGTNLCSVSLFTNMRRIVVIQFSISYSTAASYKKKNFTTVEDRKYCASCCLLANSGRR